MIYDLPIPGVRFRAIGTRPGRASSQGFTLNTDSELALLGRRCVPTRLLNEAGFTFEHADLDAALADIART